MMRSKAWRVETGLPGQTPLPGGNAEAHLPSRLPSPFASLQPGASPRRAQGLSSTPPAPVAPPVPVHVLTSTWNILLPSLTASPLHTKRNVLKVGSWEHPPSLWGKRPEVKWFGKDSTHFGSPLPVSPARTPRNLVARRLPSACAAYPACL